MSEDPSSRLLILAVDRDGDLESKTRVQTPVVGREPLIAAATQLAISDPEEADANALFAAVREYDRMRREGENCEVAVVCGVPDSGVNADRKIRRAVEAILAKDSFTGIVLVSDGADDEQVLPILQSMKPIVSVVRIVVKHSRTVEETYMVLGRYLRMLVYDPRYSRLVIGVPGLILVFAGILILVGRAFEAGIAILLILGSAFLYRGFSLDRILANVLSNRPYGYLRLFSMFASILIFLVGLSTGYSSMVINTPWVGTPPVSPVTIVAANPSQFLTYGPELIGYYIEGALPLIWAAFAIYIVGALLAHFARGSARIWRDVVLIVLLALLYLPIDQFSIVLTGQSSSVLLVSYVLVTLALMFAAVTVVYGRVRSRSPLLKE